MTRTGFKTRKPPSKRAKALTPTQEVRARVHERDGYLCVRCGGTEILQCAHFVAKSQSGLGVEENLVTLCVKCHTEFDQTENRKEIRKELRAYLMSKYPNWDETKLYYQKGC